jgi:hypothetical protein
VLARAAEAGSFAQAQAQLADMQMATRAIFNRLLGAP